MKKITKRIIPLALITFCVLSLCACGKTISTNKEVKVIQNETFSMPDGSGSIIPPKNETTTSHLDNNSQQASQNVHTASPNGGNQEPEVNPAEPVTQADPQPQATEYIVTITVDAQGVGGVLASTTLSFPYQPTVYDALCYTGVGIDGDGSYVSAINGIREKEHGPMSGWLYSVNGDTPMITCGAYYLNSSDNVYWYYQIDE